MCTPTVDQVPDVIMRKGAQRMSGPNRAPRDAEPLRRLYRVAQASKKDHDRGCIILGMQLPQHHGVRRCLVTCRGLEFVDCNHYR